MKKYEGYWARLRENNPEKYKQKKKEQNRRYLERQFQKELKKNKTEMLTKLEGALKIYLNKLTRILYDDVLPKSCKVCGTEDDLHIHHIRNTYPIKKKDLIRLCVEHHIEEHQKVN